MRVFLISILIFLSVNIGQGYREPEHIFYQGDLAWFYEADYTYITKTNQYKTSFNHTRLKIYRDKIVEAWVKYEFHKTRTDEYHNRYKYRLEKIQLDPVLNRIRILSIVIYNRKKELVDCEEYCYEWVEIIPGSIGEKIYLRILKYLKKS